jgi:hypothetical protein
MGRFTQEEAIIALELQQLIAEFGAELDFNDGHNVTDFYTEDGVFVAGGTRFEGHAAIAQFYADRNERVRTQQKDGVRTGRHTFVNIRTYVEGPDKARVLYTTVHYSGEGKPPLPLTGPSIVSDCRVDCVRGEDGRWRMKEFVPEPIFVGTDSFMNKTLVK